MTDDVNIKYGLLIEKTKKYVAGLTEQEKRQYFPIAYVTYSPTDWRKILRRNVTASFPWASAVYQIETCMREHPEFTIQFRDLLNKIWEVVKNA